jgi:hypothetical protein
MGVESYQDHGWMLCDSCGGSETRRIGSVDAGDVEAQASAEGWVRMRGRWLCVSCSPASKAQRAGTAPPEVMANPAAYQVWIDGDCETAKNMAGVLPSDPEEDCGSALSAAKPPGLN